MTYFETIRAALDASFGAICRYLNYVVSEITGDSPDFHAKNPEFQELITIAARSCGHGSKFIVTDRDQDNVISNSTPLQLQPRHREKLAAQFWGHHPRER